MKEKELTEEELKNVLGGVTYEVGKNKAEENPEIFRKSSDDELSQDDLQKTLGGTTYEIGKEYAKMNPEMYRKSQMDEIMQEELQNNQEENKRSR